MRLTIGILALQGDFELQRKVLENLGQSTTTVRYPHQLKNCNALIVPGGESTTMTMQISSNGLSDSIKEFAENHSIMGTCAGAIMLSQNVDDDRVNPLQIMEIDSKRNSWGRQVHSFQSDVILSFDQKKAFVATFIRAPKLTIRNEKIEILARYNGEKILVTDGKHLAASFHPEIGDDYRVHEYFIKLIK